MSRIPALPPDGIGAGERQAIELAAATMRFTPNDAKVMARNPALLAALGQLVAAVYATGKVDAGLKRLVGAMSSAAAGCRYCEGHTLFTSRRHGIDAAKLADLWTFEDSALYTPAEKAALRVALHAGQTPNAVTDDMFAALTTHYDADAQLEIVAVIAMFGFLNRWNATLDTDLEPEPAAALQAFGNNDGEKENG